MIPTLIMRDSKEQKEATTGGIERENRADIMKRPAYDDNGVSASRRSLNLHQTQASGEETQRL